MNHLDVPAPLEDPQAIEAYITLFLDSQKLTTLEKIQALRNLMASDLRMDAVFHDCCQDIILQLHRASADVPTTTVPDPRTLLMGRAVLLRLETMPLQAVVGGNIAFRVSCIEELGRMHRADLLIRQIGHLHHWKEGQAMIQTLLRTATPDQLFQVLVELIRSRFGSYVYREESVDLLFSAVVNRASYIDLAQLALELKKSLVSEQCERYASMVRVGLVASQMKDELSSLIDVSSSSSAHAQSGAFILDDSVDVGGTTYPAGGGAAAGVATGQTGNLPATRMDFQHPEHVSGSAPVERVVLPPRPHSGSESIGFLIDEGGE